jgi:ribosomal protein S18 acetylase RimI-like enzyme
MKAVKLPKTFCLKSGAEVLVRQMTMDDEPGILEFFRQLPLEDRHFLRNDVTNADKVHRFVTDDTHDRLLAVVGEIDGRIVASANLDRNHFGWMSHIGEIRVVIAHDFQHIGFGAILTKLLMTAAVNSRIEKVVVEASDGQKALMHNLEKLGFKKEAILKRHVMDLSGRKRDLLIYTFDVSHIWDKMEDLVSDYSPMQGD